MKTARGQKNYFYAAQKMTDIYFAYFIARKEVKMIEIIKFYKEFF